MEAGSSPRRRLTRQRVLTAATALADRDGLEALTMRRLGHELGVEAMSLYKHVANKDAILDGLVDLIVSEMQMPTPGADWKAAMRQRAVSAREVLRSHPWAIGLFESRGSSGRAVRSYLDATLATLRAGGFTLVGAAHAFWLLDSFTYGHVVQEISLTFNGSRGPTEVSAATNPSSEGEEDAHLAELTALQESATTFSFDSEFEFGLNLILEALEAFRTGD